MAFAFGGAGALLKAFVPVFPKLMARGGMAAACRLAAQRMTGGPAAAPAVPVPALSPAAEAALACLDLPPDGPIDPDAAPRARLSPEAAARNFVRWSQALDLDGDYGTRSIYALYCEFSEVDGRPPVRDTRFLPALAEISGIAVARRGRDKACRQWRWTIAPAKPIEAVAEAIAPDVWTHVSAPASVQIPDVTAAPAAPNSKTADVHSNTAAEQSRSLPEAERAPSAAAPAPAPAQAPAAEHEVAEALAPVTYVLPADPRLPIRRKGEPASPAAKPTRPASARASAPAAQSAAAANAATQAAEPSKAKAAILLSRFVDDTEHPFSPAGLREREKNARRLRLYAAASRKQRGAVRRAA